MSFGTVLTELRIEKGIGQKEIATYLKVTVATISNYEKDRHFPDPETICKLADFFGVTTDYMLGRTPFRYDPKLLTSPFTKNYTVSDLINTSLDLSPKHKDSLAEYIEVLRFYEQSNEQSSEHADAQSDLPTE